MALIVSSKVSSALRGVVRSVVAFPSVRWQTGYGGNDRDDDMEEGFDDAPRRGRFDDRRDDGYNRRQPERRGYSDRWGNPGAGEFGQGRRSQPGGFRGGPRDFRDGPRDFRDSPRDFRDGPRDFRGGDGRRYGGFFEQGSRQPRMERREVPLPDEPPFDLFVRNLNYEADENAIRQFFEGYTVLSVKILRNEFGNSRGLAIVEVETRDEALKAISDLSGQDCMNRATYVAVGLPRRQPRDHIMGDEQHQEREATEDNEDDDQRS